MDVDEDEDLPAVNLNSPMKKPYMGQFKMPDTSVLLAQRKLEDEQNNLVAKIINQSQMEDSGDDVTPNISNSSNFSMPDADLIAASRKQEQEENLLIDDLLQEQEDINKSEITFCLEALQIDKLSLAIPGENPGIDIAELPIEKLLDAPSKFRCQFIRNFVKMVKESDSEEHLRIILDHLLISIVEMYADEKMEMHFEDILCHTILLCAIILDRKCRLVFTAVTTTEVLCRILDKVKPTMQTKPIMDRLSNQIIVNFQNSHNLLHLAECMVIKCNPADIDSDPSFFSSRLAKHILFKTLCNLIGYPRQTNSNPCGKFSELKIILAKAEKIDSLLPYEQYIMVKLANELQWMFDISSAEKTKEHKARKWIITYFSALKCNKAAAKSADFFKVKALCSRINLLWQMDSEDFET